MSSYGSSTGRTQTTLKQILCTRKTNALDVSIKDHEAELLKANKQDLGKGIFEASLTEIDWVTNDIVFVCKNLEKWAKDEKPDDIPLSNALMSPRIRKDPLGCVLIIGYVAAVLLNIMCPCVVADMDTVPTISPSNLP